MNTQRALGLSLMLCALGLRAANAVIVSRQDTLTIFAHKDLSSANTCGSRIRQITTTITPPLPTNATVISSYLDINSVDDE